MKPENDLSRLLDIMARLRTPGSGCPWDLEQTFATIAPYTIEEAYEVADAIARGDLDKGLREELGDLLLQVVFHARMAEEEGRFDFRDVVRSICEKLLRRHPHVFGPMAGRLTPSEVKGLWHRIKEEERGSDPVEGTSSLEGVPRALPALARAQKLQEKASRVGFDWPNPEAVLEKVEEEVRETAVVLHDRERAAEEIGDLLFAVVNLARHAGIDAETALRDAGRKFERRFASIERSLSEQGRALIDVSLDEMDALWNVAKAAEQKR